MDPLKMIKKLLTSLFIFFSFATSALAADLVITPTSGSYSVGQNFVVSIKVSSPDQSANAFSGEVSYPVDKLKVQSISKTNSIINFWATEPSVSSGVVKYEGVSVNPGYTGSSGLLLQIHFRAIASGTATIKFKSGSVLANDGFGTSILSQLGVGNYTLSSVDIPVDDTPTKTETPSGLPDAPIVTSSTHPISTAWYTNNTPLINWTIPSNVTGAGLMVNETANTIPTVHSLGPVTGYNITKLTDGEWYAHVRFVNKYGWGPVTHYRFGIDRTPPSEFTIVPNVPSKESVTATLSLKAVDATSGIDHYTFSIDGASPITVPVGDTWQTPELSPGEHTVEGIAYDRAGNSVKATTSFATTGILPPTIDSYPKELRSGDTLIVTGHTYPNAVVVMSIEENNETANSFGKVVYQKDGEPAIIQEVTADARGVFTFIYDKKVASGTYTLSAITKIGTYESASSNAVTVSVMQSLFTRLLGWFIQYFSIIISCIAVISLISSILLYREIRKIRRHIGYPERGQKPVV